MERPVIAVLLGFLVTFIISRFLLGRKTLIQVAIKPELAQTQSHKRGTPSVGGIAFVLGTASVVALIQGRESSSSSWVLYLTLCLFALVGLFDDIVKTHHENGDGISSLLKLLLQMICAIVVLVAMKVLGVLDSTVTIPVLGKTYDWGYVYPVCAFFFILYVTNAVNISDGLDGLAAGSSIPLLVLLLIIAGFGTKYSGILSFVATLLGSLLAFLWFNTKPAKYFMGDCGSHALGAVIAVSALLLKVELIVLLASGVFLVEFASSLIQIIAIRKMKRKVFPIAPLHHVFEQRGMEETTIVGRYGLASWICSIMAFLLFLETNM